MTDEACRILDAALQLPEAERALIAVVLTDSLGDGSTPEEVEASWRSEVKRRIAAIERGETTLLDFDEVLARLREKVSKLRRSADRGT